MRSRRFRSVTSYCANRARVRWPRCGDRPPRRARAGRGCARGISYTRARLPGHPSRGARSSSLSSRRSACSRSAPDCSSARSLCRSARQGMPRSRRADALVTPFPSMPLTAPRAASPRRARASASSRRCRLRASLSSQKRHDWRATPDCRETCAALAAREHRTKHASPSLSGCGAVESELETSSFGELHCAEAP